MINKALIPRHLGTIQTGNLDSHLTGQPWTETVVKLAREKKLMHIMLKNLHHGYKILLKNPDPCYEGKLIPHKCLTLDTNATLCCLLLIVEDDESMKTLVEWSDYNTIEALTALANEVDAEQSETNKYIKDAAAEILEMVADWKGRHTQT